MTITDQSAAEAVGSAPLDTMLSDAGHTVTRWLPGRPALRFATALAKAPRPAAKVAGNAAAELVRVARGRSHITPDKKDKRFTDPAWMGNPVLRRVVQAYLTAGAAAEALLDEVELDQQTGERVRFLVDNIIEAAAPSNSPLLNPAAWKAAIDTGGGSITTGAKALVRDFSTSPRIPRMVDPDAFVVGRDLAITPGKVVLRNDVLELIEYTPQTKKVREVPLLVVPPTINKYYVIDLSPGRSVVEHLVQSGQHVFVVSWRNPREEGADWGTDAYVEAILEGLEAVEKISGSPRSALLGVCSGGILASMMAAHLAATGQQDRIAALSLIVTLLDQGNAGTAGAFTDRRSSRSAKAKSARKGYLEGAALAEVFAWLRPRDLVWNYWVNNYLLGEAPPAFDILSWNADSTRMPARLHQDFIDIAHQNLLTEPGAATLFGEPVDLSTVDVDSYVVAGIADHLCPWQNCYASTQLLGGTSRFVLSTSGHIAAIINPPGNKKAYFHASEDTPDDAQEWLDATPKTNGSWWENYSDWLREHSGAERDAPKAAGGSAYEVLCDAPGEYVMQR